MDNTPSAVPSSKHPPGAHAKPPTIRDVARRAGVGVGTVSRVLNSKGHVSNATREKVLRAVEELNYQPNNLARSLATGRSRLVALVIPDITNPFFPTVARGVEDAASTMGYTVVLCNTDGDPAQEMAYAKTLRELRVDGIIFVVSSPDSAAVWELLRGHFPLALIDRQVEGASVDAVLVDNVSSAREATRHLIRLGHRRIAHISGPPQLTTSRDRLRGYLEALGEAGLEADETLIRAGDFRYHSGYARMKELLEAQDPPTAVFAANDLMAIGAIRALGESGRRVPDDVAVVGFDDILLASLVRPALTTVSQPAYQMGVTATELLIRRMDGLVSGPPQEVVLTPQLVIRESCGGKVHAG